MANGDNITLTNTNPRFWTDSGAPGASVPDAVVGQCYLDSATGDLYQCKVDVFGSQIWYKFINLNNVSSTLSSILPAAAISGSYNDLSNKPTIPTINAPSYSTPTFSSATTAAQISATRDADVRYSFPASITSILGTQTITAMLKYADNVGMSTNAVNVLVDTLSVGGVLSLAVTNGLQLFGRIPAGKYAQVTFTVSGGATAPSTLSAGQVVLI